MFKERPLSEREIDVLKKDLENIDKRNSKQKRFLFIWSSLAFVIGSFVYFKLHTATEHYLLLGTVFIYILIGVWVYWENYKKSKKQKNSILYVLNENKVKSIQVVSDQFIELPETEDEGSYYLYQLDNNKILSFGGQEFHRTENFPNNNFEMVLSFDKLGELVLFEQYFKGDKIKPIKEICGQKKWDLINRFNYVAPVSLALIDGKLENLAV